MAGKLAKTDYQILYRIICDCMPHAQRQKFLELRTNNPEKAWQIVEEVWHEFISQIIQSLMKKEKEGAADSKMKLIHREPWVN
jgi:hypothetical protein